MKIRARTVTVQQQDIGVNSLWLVKDSDGAEVHCWNKHDWGCDDRCASFCIQTVMSRCTEQSIPMEVVCCKAMPREMDGTPAIIGMLMEDTGVAR